MATVTGDSVDNDGVRGFSAASDYSGVVGTNTGGGVGVLGQSTQGPGVVGNSEDSRGIQGHSTKEHGVFGDSTKGAGVVGQSTEWVGVFAETNTQHQPALFAKGPNVAGIFEGDVVITGSLTVQGVNIGALVAQVQALQNQVASLEVAVRSLSADSHRH